jgi:hypothetical protein
LTPRYSRSFSMGMSNRSGIDLLLHVVFGNACARGLDMA